MDKYIQTVPWIKNIVQKYHITCTCFRGNIYRAQSQNATVNFSFSRHVQFPQVIDRISSPCYMCTYT